MPGELRVGCSGWSYRDWRGIVYPADLPQTRWFAHYATMFDTVELNSTFYRLPAEKTVDAWANAAPAGFIYAVKVGAFGSHRMKLRDPESWVAKHVDRARHLGAHLGPNLVQLPPGWRRDVDRLDHFLAVVPPAIRWCVELRERSWLHDEVFDTLARHNTALCIHDLLADHPFVMTTDWTYVRFHGPDARAEPYHGSYGPARLRAHTDRLAEVLSSGADVYCYFNNDFHGHAVRDAMLLRADLTERLAAPER
jgi:uncharacterized protein YecE (DUF72 family)